jgi:pimeloyl-ACP methyl ester carboxylesterase
MTVLPEPREDSRIELPDGRTLAVARFGPADGVPVIAHHGTPASRLDLPGSIPMLADLGVDLIMFDRAGYGRSSPLPGRAVAAAAADAVAIADALGIDRFGAYGVSGGGPHSLACAALLGDRVTRTACVVGVGPYGRSDLDFRDGLNELSVAEFEIALRGRSAMEEYVAAFVEETRDKGTAVMDEWGAELPEPDRDAYYGTPEARALLARALTESLVVSGAGWVDDGLAFVSPWRFELSSISTPVAVWAGAIDRLVPIGHARYLAAQIPGAELHIVPDRGHALDDYPIFEWLTSA